MTAMEIFHHWKLEASKENPREVLTAAFTLACFAALFLGMSQKTFTEVVEETFPALEADFRAAQAEVRAARAERN